MWIDHDGPQVKLHFRASQKWTFNFVYATNHEAVAEAVARDFRGTLDSLIRALREQAYDAGFRDAQKKRPRKAKRFSSFFGVMS